MSLMGLAQRFLAGGAALLGALSGGDAIALPHGAPPMPMPPPMLQPGPMMRPPPMAHSPRRGDSEAALDQMRQGRIRPLRDIERRVVPRMPGADYLGPEFDGSSGTYRLKFMRGGSVIWVDVDGRTGEIVGRSGE